MINSSTETLLVQPADTNGITNSLSSSDVVEIRKFTEGKTRIIDLTESLSSKPVVDPFEGFVQIDEHEAPTIEVISKAWRDLEEKLSQVTEWQDERDDVEAEATQFEVDDMERLRKVAKAATEREMSPQDTDLIEITIQTLVALDTLLRLLKSRREALDLLHGRLRWEERRKDCWTTYISLSHDLDDLIRQARWSPQIYQRTTAASESIIEVDDSYLAGISTLEWSPLTTRSASGLTTTSHAKRQGIKVKTQSVALQSRCRSFIDEIVPLASRQLDELIEQRQLPEVFLDEQDRLEDLAESINEVEVFMIQLSFQWRKADDTFRQLRSLHIQGKQLTTALTNAQRENPSEKLLADFERQRDLLKLKMETLCGVQAASVLISDSSLSAEVLIDSIHKNLPEPTCKAWPDQDHCSKQVQQVLAKEMMAAAKHFRSAYCAAEKYERGLHLFDQIHDLILQLKTTARLFQRIRDRAQLGWTEDSDIASSEDLTSLSAMSIAGSNRDGLPPDLTTVDCLNLYKHDAFIEAFPALLICLGEVEQESRQRIQAMEKVIDNCIRDGLSHSLYRTEVDEAIYEIKTVQNEARAAVDETSASLELFKQVRAIYSHMTEVEVDYQECLQAETSVIMLRADRSTQSSNVYNPQSIADVQMQVDTLLQRADETSETVHSVVKALETSKALLLSRALLDRSNALLHSVETIQGNSNWLQVLEKQRCQLIALQEEHDRLTQIGLQIKVGLEGEQGNSLPYLCLPEEVTSQSPSVAEQENLSLQLQQKDATCEKIKQYVSATHTDMVLCGSIPESLMTAWAGKSSVLPSSPKLDDIARQSVNEWCSQLSSLIEEIEASWKEAQQRHYDIKQERTSLGSQQERLNTALSNFDSAMAQAVAICDAVEMNLEVLEGKDVDMLVQSVDTLQKELQQRLQDIFDISKQGQSNSSVTDRLKRYQKEVAATVIRAESVRRHLVQQNTVAAIPVDFSEGRVEIVYLEEIESNPDKISPASINSSAEVSAQHNWDEREGRAKSIPQVPQDDAPESSKNETPVHKTDLFETARASHMKQEDRKQRSDPLPMISKKTQIKEINTVEDVFGSVLLRETFSMSDIAKDKGSLIGSASILPVPDGIMQVSIGSLPGDASTNLTKTITPRTFSPPLEQPNLPSNVIMNADNDAAMGKLPRIDIKEKVRELIEQSSIDIVEEQIQPKGKVQFQNGLALPTVEEAERVKREWSDLKLTANSIIEGISSLPASEVDQVHMTLQLRDAKVRRFVHLAAFGAQQLIAEEALSRFLNVLDQSNETKLNEEVQKRLAEVSQSISQATLTAEPVLTDARVRRQLDQLRHSYQDMAAMAKDACIPPEEREDQDNLRSTCPSRSSSASSLPSLSGSASDVESVLDEQRQNLVSLLVNSDSRSESLVFAVPDTPSTSQRRLQSSSSGTYATAPQSTPRQSMDRRVVSDGVTMVTPSRLPIATSRSNMELSTPRSSMPPRPGISSNVLSSITTKIPHPSSNGHHTHNRSDSGSLQRTRLPTRSPSGASLRGSTPQRMSSTSSSSKPNQYRANPKSKLDIAVGKIVNRLPMPVKITHASVSGNSTTSTTGSKAKEQWHDESGRYWVGQPDPKLCFCRILRSRTVMVRIGGGWQELGTYILKHFSHLGNDTSLSVAASPHVSPQLDRGKTEKLPWINSSTLLQNQTPTGKTNTGVKTMADLSPENAYLTPVHERDEQGGSASFRSSRGGGGASSSSAASTPLAPLCAQFENSSKNSEDMMHGMWIRRERKTSQNSITRIPSWSQQQKDHTRSTLASRNRNVSMEPRNRVESTSNKDENGGINHYTRVRAESINLSDATVRRQQRQTRNRISIPARFSPALS